MVLLTIQPFEYFQPKTIREAIALLEKYGDQAKILAGGTDLVPRLKARQADPKYIVDINRIKALDYIKDGEGLLQIGAASTYDTLLNSSLVQRRASVLTEAIQEIGTIQVRNRGTLGGNLVNASPAADSPPALMVLQARLKMVGPQGERIVPIEEFFVSVNKTVIHPDELLTEIQIPHLPANTGCAFKKLGRRIGPDLAVACAAATVTMEGDCCEDLRIALGSVAPTAIRVRKTEKFFWGKKIDDETLEKGSDIVEEEISSGLLGRRSSRGFSRAGSPEYRIAVSKILVKNAVKTAVERGRN